MMKWLKLVKFFVTAPGWLRGTLLGLLALVALLALVLMPILGLLVVVGGLVLGLVSLIASPIGRLKDRLG